MYYSQGACLYAEALNPGFDETLRCVRLVKLMEDWDVFLDRAEAFHLSEETAMRIWNGRQHAALESRALCPFTEPGFAGPDGGDELDCRHLFQGACQLVMPRCGGPCDRFFARNREVR